MSPERTVLLVDDELEILESLRRALRNESYALVTTTSPLEALELVEKGGIDVVIADIDMPEMTGHELVTRLRRDYPDVVRILLTGGASLESALDAINRGEVHRYLTKPWQNRELRETLRDTLARLDELRRGAEAGRQQRVEELMRAELNALHPGVLDVAVDGGVHVLDAPRLRALLLQVGSEGLDAVIEGCPAGESYDVTTRKEPFR